MLKIKKRIIVCLTLLAVCLLIVPVSACKKTQDLSAYLSQLQCDLYLADSEEYKLKAFYGFNETPVKNDGVIGKTTYKLTFILYADLTQQAEYTLSLSIGENTHELTFKPDGVKGAFTTTLEVENFTLKEFNVKLLCADKTTDIVMRSALPQNAISYKTALDCVLSHQEALVKSYFDQSGTFNGEIRQRIIVRDGKPYWYVGLVDKTGGVKALLVDGISGEILAVREVV